jgi:hypothetical protein
MVLMSFSKRIQGGEDMRRTGIEIMGDVSRRMHFCQFFNLTGLEKI